MYALHTVQLNAEEIEGLQWCRVFRLAYVFLWILNISLFATLTTSGGILSDVEACVHAFSLSVTFSAHMWLFVIDAIPD